MTENAVRMTLIGGPTALLEIGAARLLTDPPSMSRAATPRARSPSPRKARPRLRPKPSGRSMPCCSAMTSISTTSTDRAAPFSPGRGSSRPRASAPGASAAMHEGSRPGTASKSRRPRVAACASRRRLAAMAPRHRVDQWRHGWLRARLRRRAEARNLHFG